MTIQAQTPRKVHTADGVQTTFAYDFLIVDQGHLDVFEDNVLTTKSYTVTGVGNPSGGTVVFSPVVPANNVTVSLVRNVPLTQEVDYRPYDPFPAETHEAALDKLTQITQQLQDESDRSLKSGVDTPPGVLYELPLPEQNRGLYWANDPNPTRIVNGPSAVEIEGYRNDAQAAASAAATSETNAAASASSASTSAANASSSETNAANSETRAQEWAEKETEVLPGQFSSKYWAGVAQANAGLPAGIVVQNPFNTIPNGWLLCNGQAVSRTIYSQLFQVLGTSYGSGDGSTTFNLPDYRGQYLRGTDRGAGIDPDAASRTDRGDGTTGDNVGTKQGDAVGQHQHLAYQASTNYNADGGVNQFMAKAGNSQPPTDTTGGPTTAETRTKNIAVDYIIFTGTPVIAGPINDLIVDGSLTVNSDALFKRDMIQESWQVNPAYHQSTFIQRASSTQDTYLGIHQRDNQNRTRGFFETGIPPGGGEGGVVYFGKKYTNNNNAVYVQMTDTHMEWAIRDNTNVIKAETILTENYYGLEANYPFFQLKNTNPADAAHGDIVWRDENDNVRHYITNWLSAGSETMDIGHRAIGGANEGRIRIQQDGRVKALNNISYAAPVDDTDLTPKKYCDDKFVDFDSGSLARSIRAPLNFIANGPTETYTRFTFTDDGNQRALFAWQWNTTNQSAFFTTEMYDGNRYRGCPYEFSFNENDNTMVWQVKMNNLTGAQIARLRLDNSGNLDIPFGNPTTAKNATTKEYVDAISDDRFKTNKQSFDALQTVDQLNLYRFNWTQDAPRNTGETSANVIAQELQQILPEFVHQNIDVDENGSRIGDIYYVDRDALLAYALRAIQELSTKVKALEAAQP